MEAKKKSKKTVSYRGRLVGLAHQVATTMGMDDETRRAAQKKITGCESCKDMGEAQLRNWLYYLKRLGADVYVPNPPDKKSDGPLEKITSVQYAEIERLCFERGWQNGLEHPDFVAFLRRTAKIDKTEFLTKRLASQVINGLRRWDAQKKAKNQTNEGKTI